MFTHLHLHTEYSLLDGLSRIPDVMDRVATIGQTSVAMTDHGALYGAVDFYKEARARGIKPIIGIEAYVAPDSRLKKSDSRANNYFHLTLLAKDMEGYRNLIQLSTKSHLEGFYYKPRMDKELLAAHGKGIIALSGCPSGEMHKLLLEERYDEAKALAGFFGDVFDDFYLEVMKHDEPEINAQCEKVMRGLVTLSRETSIPLVATNDSHYTVQDDASIHDVLLCIGTNSTVDDPKRQLKMHDTSYYVKSEDEMLALFPETPEAVTNTQLVADQCNLDLEFGRLHLPEPEVPAGVTAHQYLTSLARAGLNRRYPFADDAVRERLQYELDVVEKTGFTSYFLVVQDVAQFCQRQDIMLGVRGSAAASIILYALDVTFIDPLASRLVFERFLHVDRKEPPDVDFDIPDDRRDEVIRYVAEKYGYDRVAQIITFGTMGAKAAVRDTGRALGMAYGDVDRVARLVPNALHITLTRALDESPELASAYELDPQVSRLIDTARRLEGVARHASTHAAGVVISREPLVEYVPLQRSPRGDESSIPTTQFAMSQVAEIGLLKMDFLGLANLTILGRAVKIIERTQGIKIDLAALPDRDEKTYEMLGRGDTFGVFQLESPGMRRLIQELRPDSIADLMALVALYRPGPMAHIGTYCRAKHDRSLVQYPHPDLAEILDETYGVIAYQDQVLFVLQKFAGYDLKDADAIRKAMSKKIASLMKAEGEKFVAASISNGYSEQEARAIFDLILPFAGYAFNKAHSAVYGTIAYQTGYLKANYPHEYMTAVLSSAGAHERIAQAVAECVRIGVSVRAPDVNSSGASFELHHIDADGAVADPPPTPASSRRDRSLDLSAPTSNIQHPTSNQGVPTVCFGLGTVKNVGIGAAECIIEARDAGGPFASIEDFTKRVDMKALNKRALESLVKCGALDALAPRGMLLGNIDRIVSLAQREAKLKETGQSTMFDMFGDSVATPLPSLELVDYEISKAEMLAWEKELLGVYVSEHPFTSAAVTIAKHTSALVSEITGEMDGRDVVIAGMVNGVRSLTTKAGKLFVAVTVEDLSGSTEVTVWSDVYEPTRDLWAPGNILLMLVRVRERADRLQSSVQQVSLVQAADGSFSHEQFGIPPWLTDAVRATAGVAVRLLPSGTPESLPPPASRLQLPASAPRTDTPRRDDARRDEASAPSNPAPNTDSAPNGLTSPAALQPPASSLPPPPDAPSTAAPNTETAPDGTTSPGPRADAPRTDASGGDAPRRDEALAPSASGTNAEPAPNGTTSTAVVLPPASRPPPPPTLRFHLHESDDADADRARLDALITLLASYPGDDGVRLFIHLLDGDKIELTLPDARICEDLRTAGIATLAPNGNADPLPQANRTPGPEPVEV